MGMFFYNISHHKLCAKMSQISENLQRIKLNHYKYIFSVKKLIQTYMEEK